MRALAAAGFLLAMSRAGLAAPPADEDLEAARTETAKALLRVGVQIERQILSQDVDALVGRVPPEGLRCGTSVIPRAKVARDLRDRDSWLHGVLFGGTRRGDQAGAPTSLAGVLKGAGEIAIVVSFRSDPRAGPAGRPCIEYRAKDFVTPDVPFCFEERDGHWWFTESLYPCG